MKENWKDYLFPSCWAVGLLALLVCVVLGGQANGRGFAQTESRQKLEKPTSLESSELEKWCFQLIQAANIHQTTVEAAKIPEIIRECSELDESDGALYYCVMGWICNFYLNMEYKPELFTLAIQSFDKAIELDDRVSSFYLFRGDAKKHHSCKGNAPDFYDKAAEDYRKAAELDPKSLIALEREVWLYVTGDKDKMIAACERVLEIDPKNLTALANLARAYQSQCYRDPDNIEYIQKGLEIVIRLKEINYNNAFYYAEEFVGRMRNADPTITPETHPDFYIKDHFVNRAYFDYFQNKQYGEAVKYFDLAETFNHESIYYSFPQSKEIFFNHSGVLNMQLYYGISLYETGNYEKALVYFEKYLESTDHRPGHQKLFRYHFNTLLRLEKYEELIDYYLSGKVLQRDIENDRLFIDIATTMIKVGKIDGMLTFLRPYWRKIQEAIANPRERRETEDFLTLYAEACYQGAHKEAAREQYDATSATHCFLELTDAWVKKDSSRHPLYKKAGMLLSSQENFDRAAEYFEKYLLYAPHDAEALSALLDVYKKTEKNEAAYQVATQWVCADPQNADAWIERASLVPNQLRAVDTGIQDLTRAIDILLKQETSKSRLSQLYAWRAELFKTEDYLSAIEDYFHVMEYLPEDCPLAELSFTKFRSGTPYLFYLEVLDYIRNKPELQSRIDFCNRFVDEPGVDRLWILEIRGNAYFAIGSAKDKTLGDFKELEQSGLSLKSKGSMKEIYRNMAMCYWVTEYDKAIEYFTKAIEVDPEYDIAYLDRALLYNRLSRRAAWAGVTAKFSDEECQRFTELSHKDYDMAEAIAGKRGNNIRYARDQ